MRTENTLRNIKVNFLSQILNIIVQFVSRSFFIKFLGITYLGINGLFSNILTILSLADLGIGNVLIYSMYKPLANQDKNKINILMKEYKKIYNIIALVVLIFGMSITPFLNYIVGTNAGIENLKLIFLLYLANTVVSYLCIYRISIINADQKQYIVTGIQQIFSIISNVVMIIVLAITRNFILYLLTQIIFSILCNLYLSNKAKKLYPFIANKCEENITQEEKKKIFKDTRAMMFHKIGGVVVSGTDNILMSVLINIATVGLYSNYLVIINSLKRFTNIVFSSVASSVGNLNAKEDIEYIYDIFKKLFYINFIIFTFSTVCLICLINPFVRIWLGESYIFGDFIVFCICLSFFIDGMRQTVLTFKDSMGLFQQDQYKPIMESLSNLFLSIILAIKFGVVGIILGTILSMFFICVGTEAFVLYKYGFKKKVLDFAKIYGKYLLIGSITLVVCIFVNNHITRDGIIYFAIKSFITAIMCICCLLIMTAKSDEFKFYYNKFIKRNNKN